MTVAYLVFQMDVAKVDLLDGEMVAHWDALDVRMVVYLGAQMVV